ncbi:MAG: hypothetical protein RLZZ396_1861, partial [Planctomycetota bacterium]
RLLFSTVKVLGETLRKLLDLCENQLFWIPSGWFRARLFVSKYLENEMSQVALLPPPGGLVPMLCPRGSLPL